MSGTIQRSPGPPAILPITMPQVPEAKLESGLSAWRKEEL